MQITYRDRMGQQPLKVAFVETNGNFLEQRLIRLESVQSRRRNQSRRAGLNTGIVHKGDQRVDDPDDAGLVQMGRYRGEHLRQANG